MPSVVVAVIAVSAAACLPSPRVDDRQADATEIARAAGVRVLGAMRGYAATTLWLRAGEAYRRGDFIETSAMYRLIAALQPRNPAVYDFLSWNQAYNIGWQFPGRDERFEWVEKGLNTLHTGLGRIPADAGLMLDEWHFLLNRSRFFPVRLLLAEVKRHGEKDEVWQQKMEQVESDYLELNKEELAELEQFLAETGLLVDIFEMMAEALELPATELNTLLDPNGDDIVIVRPGAGGQNYSLPEREWIRAGLALPEAQKRLLLLCDWCRFHLMTLVIEPALEIEHRSLSVDYAATNTYRLAWEKLRWLRDPALENIVQPRYKLGAIRGFAAGKKNAMRLGGLKGVARFEEDVRVNYEYSGISDWLPKAE